MPTATGLRISSVNGTAFLDNCPADIIAAAGTGAIVNIYDASSRLISGKPDSVGSSEGLSGELIDGWTNHASYPYETFNSTGADIIQAINLTAASGIAYKATTSIAGALYKVTATVTKTSGTSPLLDWGTSNTYGNPKVRLSTAFGTTSGLYSTTPGAYTYFGFWNASTPINFAVSGFSLKQVTAPSSSGVIIKDLSGNQNFISKDASFTYNAASYTYEIISAGNAFNYFQNMMR